MTMSQAAGATKPPFRKMNWLPRDIDVERRPDGTLVLQSRIPLQPYAPHIPALVAKWAAAAPDRTWIAQRKGADRQWRRISYAEGKALIDSLTQALLDLGVPAGRPLAILSGNSLEHALMTQAAMQARLPVAPFSPSYSLLSQDHAKLKYLFNLVKPAAVLVQDGVQFQKALAALQANGQLDGLPVVHVDRAPEGIASHGFDTLSRTPVTPAVQASIDAITPDTVGKLLFTSGSTGMPKAVINTQRMMCANVAQGNQVRSQPGPGPTVVLDWMPWNHTMGGNSTFHGILGEGGTLYIDDGRPVPGQYEETLNNLREIAPSLYSSAPSGYAMLAAALEKDDALARNFFKNLNLLAYGGARLPDDLYARMQALAVQYTGHRLVFYTGWGSTETAPTSTGTYWETERVGLIGLPFPGVQLKMLPTATPNMYELRLKGINVFPGYHAQPELTAAAFDEEGFYKIGDAGVLSDPADPAAGLIFAGRVTEEFKLTTGTFVHVGELRTDCIAACSPVLLDALVTGQDRPYIGLLAWPNLAACRALIGQPDAGFDAIVAHPAVREAVQRGLEAHNATTQGASSRRIGRVVLLTEPPSIDGNELTDKGYINQKAGLTRRAALVERLYAEQPTDDVIVLK
ncbi:acyl-CoA synthetase [Rubrivivax pictus]|uniref:Acyl-CoA synthetase n=2 Tax=Pseudaquabacterium pictum TaxID=2315236 RepID=A0A480ANZ7_9BURK|nr:acyl-CoA synthetase [Rubrivivax pictus]